MKKFIIRLIIVLVLCLIIPLACSLIKCEVLTYQYAQGFHETLNTEFGEVNLLKVIDYYKSDTAKVYCVVDDNTCGELLRFKYNAENDNWYIQEYLGGWSEKGNADDLVYPYLWHFVYFMF